MKTLFQSAFAGAARQHPVILKLFPASLRMVFLFLLFCAFSQEAMGAKRYWVGGISTSWKNKNNWSATSGGGAALTVPGSSDTAYFDGGGVVNCSIDSAVNVKRFEIQSGYTATISQNSNTITVGSSGMSLSDGTFTGSSSTITTTSFVVSGTAFTSTSGTLNATGNFTVSSGSFTHNSGKVSLNATLTFTVSNTGGTTFYDLTVAPTSTATLTVTSTSTITVAHTFTVGGSAATTINGGTVDIAGNISITSSTAGGGGSATLLINGSGTQRITGNSTAGAGRLPKVTITKTGTDSLLLFNTITFGNNLTHNSSVFTAGSSTAWVVTGTVTGSVSFNNLGFFGGNTITVASGTTLTVEGTLTPASGGLTTVLNTGTIHAHGNISYAGTTGTSTIGGTATIVINGTGSQTLTGTSTWGSARTCNIQINKTTGTLTITNIITVLGSWTHTHGIVNAGTSIVIFAGTKTISGENELYDVYFSGSGAATYTIASGDTLTVNGELSVDGTSAVTLSTGVIAAKGNIVITNTSSSTGGTATLYITGGNTDTLTGSGTSGAGSLPNVIIDKSSNTLTLVSTISCAGDWTYVQGTVDPDMSSMVFTGTKNLDGQGTSSTMSFYKLATFSSGTRTLTGNLDINDKLLINSSTTLSAGSYTINVGGQWSDNGTWTYGTSTVTFDGGSYTKVSKSGGGLETFYNLAFNRNFANSSILLDCPVKVNNALTMTKGKVKTTSTNYLELIDNATLSGGHDSAYVHGPMRKTGDDAFTFPLGDTTLTSAAYHPLAISATAVNTNQFEAQYFDAAQSQGSAYNEDSLEMISSCEYWTLKRNAGSASTKATLGWNTNNCIPNGPAVMRVSRWDGSQWISMGYDGSTGNSSKGTVSGSITNAFSSLTYLVLAQKKHPQYLQVSTYGMDTLIGSDTVKYKISGSQLSGTYKAGGLRTFNPATPHLAGTDSVDLKFFLTSRTDTTIVRFAIDHYAEITNVRVKLDTMKTMDTSLYKIVSDTVLVLLNGNSTWQEQYQNPVTVVLSDGLVMSPNGDSQYDTFVVQGGTGYGSYQLTIYDRFGTQVYQTTNPANAWNGLDGSSNMVLPGTYSYTIVVDGQTVNGQFLLEY